MEKHNIKIKNICMLSTHGYFDPIPQLGRTDTGGQIVYVLELAKALSSQHCKVDIYTRWFDESKNQIDPIPGCPEVRVIRIPSGKWEFIAKEKIYDVLPELAENMVTFIKENKLKYDLFHGHYVDAGIVTLDVAKAFDKPAFFTAHSLGAWKRDQMGGNPEEMEKKYNFKHRISEELRIFKSVKAQTVTTQLQQEKLEELYDFTTENIEIIPPGVDVHTYYSLKPNKNKVKTNLPEKYIFCLSRIDTNKGHDLLLNAFDIVKKEISDIALVIGGGSPKPQQREKGIFANMRKIINEKGLQESVHIIGYVPDELMPPYYRQAELFVLPSLFEPFGMTAIEAMACGTPVIASKFGGIKNVISTGENGILVNPENPNEFADEMITLLKDKKKAKYIGQKGNETIVKYYSWEAIAERHLAFYHKYIG
ncbi:MAG: glycosyltransferase [Candidatus Cloacimonetes bacterium]|nr:glycosyltransferase [Candidatus Cloacimonadota bacterium]